MADSFIVIVSDLTFYLIHSGPNCIPKHAYLLYSEVMSHDYSECSLVTFCSW